MLFTQLLAFVASTAVVTAAPAPAPGPVVIGPDDIILWGNGRTEVMKRSEYKQLFGDYHAIYANKTLTDADMEEYTEEEFEALKNNPLQKRKGEVKIMIPGRTDKFLDWDIQMSEVALGLKDTGTRISITSGFTVSNAVNIKGGADAKLVEDFFALSVDLSARWETANVDSTMYFADVPPGKYGCWVSNPWVKRTYATIWSGEIGTAGRSQTVYVNQYTADAIRNVGWVQGTISMCIGNEFPLPRCLGSGYL